MTSDHFACGHARNEANTTTINGRAGCLICKQARERESRARQRRREVREATERYFDHRVRYLPVQLENTRRKLAALENEARRYGLTDLLETHQ